MQTCAACTAILADEKPSVNSPPPGGSFLSDVSPRDRPWDVHRSQADDVTAIYLQDEEFKRIGVRILSCSGRLGFVWGVDGKPRLNSAQFCRVRLCPTCQWRRSQMWRARFLKALPGIQLAHPTSRYLFLTLTWKNVPIADLKKSLKISNEAFHRLRKRKEFSNVQGWIRTTEVTRSPDGSAHPHFHVLLMVPSNYFTKNYVPHAAWVEAWAAAQRVNYEPQVFIQALKTGGDIASDVREVLKYSVKPDDMTTDPDWFKELTRQLFKLRFIASGGVLKDVLRESEETDEQLMLLDPDSVEFTKKPEFFANWARPLQKYVCE